MRFVPRYGNRSRSGSIFLSRTVQNAKGHVRPVRKRARSGLAFEQLEPRLVLSTIIVDSLGDTEQPDGKITLREAIALADTPAYPNSDEIVFDSSLGLVSTAGTIALTLGELRIESDVTINGPGAGKLIVDAGGGGRVFNIDVNTVDPIEVSLSGMIITGGVTSGDGGGILNRETLSVNDVHIVGNSGNNGGGIRSYGILTIADSTIADNVASYGGGLESTGATTVTRSIIRDNSATNFGGGIQNSGTRTLVEHSTITSNSGRDGGGVFNNSGIALVSCTIAGNRAADDGGGVASSYGGDVVIANSVLVGNTATDQGGGVYKYSGDATIVNSTIAGNEGADGGGIWLYQWNGAVALVNSIVALNAAASNPEISGTPAESHDNLVGTNPEFVANPSDDGDGWGDNPATPDVDESANDDFGQLQLLTDSPAVDAGSNLYLDEIDSDGAAPDLDCDLNNSGTTGDFTLITDLDGAARIAFGTVDQGAYEFTLAPVLAPIGAKSVDELETLSFTATAIDPDDPIGSLTFSLVGNVPIGAQIDEDTGVFTWTPTEDDGPGQYTFTVVVSDGVLTDSEDITVTVEIPDLNQAPTDILLSFSQVPESLPVGTVVGLLDTSDPDNEPGFTYSFAGGVGDDNNNSFTIAGDELRTGTSFDFESQSSFSIRIRSVDSGGLWIERPFPITVTDVNEPPTEIHLSSTEVPEMQPAGTVVGLLETSDPDNAPGFTYSLVSGAGDSDNGVFAIANDELRTDESFDFEARSSYSVRIRSVDSGNLAVEQAFHVTVTNVNPPAPNAPPVFDLRLVADINNTIQSSNPSDALVIGGQAFFVGSSPYLGTELHRTDGTDAGTYLVKDLVEGDESGSPRSLTEFNEELFFLSEYSYLDPGAPPDADPETRTGLWKSDGTEGGTVLVKDFEMLASPPGALSRAMHVVSGSLLFFLGDPMTAEELWTSDGTEAGTSMVTSFVAAGPPSLDAMPTAVLGSVLLFNRDVETMMGTHSLWRTDGTPGGTFELRTGEMGAGPLKLDPSLTVVGNEVFFVSTSIDEGKELWKTDGSVGGTTLVKDIAIGPEDSGPTHLTEMNGTLFFSAGSDLMGGDRELWKSDGTSGGTTRVKDIWPGVDSGISPSSTEFISFNNVLYFAAQDDLNGTELWRSDGTTAGTNMVVDAVPGVDGLWPEDLVPMGNELVFTSGNLCPDGVQLWKTDGTPVGTEQFADIDGPVSTAGAISHLTVNGSTLFFHGDNGTNGTNGTELWRSDGTTDGTIQLNDLHPGGNSGLISILASGLGGVLFRGSDGVHGTELGVSNGTPMGTRLIDVARGTPSAEVQAVFTSGDTIYLSAQGDLWISDATSAGTQMLKDFPSSLHGLSDFIESDGTVFFVAEGASSQGRELWKTDGTTNGTVLVKDINPGSADSDPELFANFQDALYFVADDVVHGNELWRSYGEPENTLLFHEFVAGSADGDIEAILPVGDELYVVADGVLYDESLQILHPRMDAGSLMPWGRLLHFSGFSAEHGYELWRTDGTLSGTYLVADILPGPESSHPGGGTVSALAADTASGEALEAKLVFRALAAADNSQLFATDGSTSGTVQITEVPVVPDGLGSTISFAPVQLTRVADRVFFEAYDDPYGRELWVTNGTAIGTSLVKDLRPGPAPDPLADPVLFNLEELIAFRERLVFRTSEDASGTELWVSDGSVDGTGLAIDILVGANSGNPANFVLLQDQLYLSANTAEYGTSSFSDRGGELFRLNEAPYAFDVAGTTAVGTPAELRLSGLDFDADALTFEVVDTPTSGAFSINGSLLAYTPNSGFNGVDHFTYRAFDGSLYSQAASVEVGVTPQTNTVSFVLAGETISEQSGVHHVDVILAQPAATDLLIPFTIEGATAVENGNQRDGTLSIPAGAATGEILVALDDDPRYETDLQLMELTLRANSAIALGSVSQHILTLTDDDPMPTVQFVSPWQSVSESDDTIRIDVGLSSASDEAVSVDVGLYGTATRNADYLAKSSTTLDFLPGQMRKSVSVRLVDDALPETRELIFAQLEGPLVGATVTSDPDRFRHLTWIDDDDTSLVSMWPSVLMQTEGDVITLEATRSGGNLASAMSIPVLVDLSGASVADYSLSGTSFDFALGKTTATLDVTLTDDATAEEFEGLSVRLDTQAGMFTPGDGTSTYIGIYDNDQATLELTIGDTNAPGVSGMRSVREKYPHGGGLNWLIDVTATLSAPLSTELSVPFVISSGAIGGYATPGKDFLLSDVDFLFAPGVTEVTRTLEILDDVDLEWNEIIRMALEPTDAQFFLRPKGNIDDGSLWKEIEIRDNEDAISISAPRSVKEDSGQFAFTVSLDEPSDFHQVLLFSISGSAQKGKDYTVPLAATGLAELSFAPGEQTKTITVNLIDNDVYDNDKSITLMQRHYMHATLYDGLTLTVSVENDELEPTVYWESDVIVLEEHWPDILRIYIDPVSAFPIELGLKFDGSAELGRDYDIVSTGYKYENETLFIPPHRSGASIHIKCKDVDGDKTILARITGGSGVYVRKSIIPSIFRGVTWFAPGRSPNSVSSSRSFSLGTFTSPNVLEITILDKSRPPAARRSNRPPSNNIRDNTYNPTVGSLAIDPNSSLGYESFTVSDGATIVPADSIPFGALAIGSGNQGLLEDAVIFFDANFNFVRDFLDLDEDGRQDLGEPIEPEVTTDLDGSFAIRISEEFDVDGSGFIETTEGRYVLVGGRDTSTSLPWMIPMAAPVGSLIVNPINTLVENLARRHDLTVDEARLNVGIALGITGYDFVGGNSIYGIPAGDPLSASAYLQQVQASSAVIQIASLASEASGLGMRHHADEVYDLLGDQLAIVGSKLDFANQQLVRELVLAINARLATPLSSDVVDGAAELIALGASKIQPFRISQFPTPLDFLNEITKAKKLMHEEIATAFADVGQGTRTIASVLADYTGETAPNFDSKVALQTIGQVIPSVVGVSNGYIVEGDSGQQMVEFTIGINGSHGAPVSLDFATFDDSALAADGDYTPVSGTLTWPVGDTDPKTVQVPIHGDVASEADEEFGMLLSNVQNAVNRMPQGIGFILNDDNFTHTVTETPGTPTEVSVVHSREVADFWEGDSLVFAGRFADDLTATLNGQTSEAIRFDFDFSAATYRGDHYILNGGASTDSIELRGGRFSGIVHQIADAASSNGSTHLLSELGPEITLDWTSVENTQALVSAVDDLTIYLPLEVTDIQISDADLSSPGVMRISSTSSQFAPMNFTNPSASLTIVTENANANVQIVSTDPEFAGTIEVKLPVVTVTGIDSTPSGFLARFNRAIDPNGLSLYDVETQAFGAADVTLVGSSVGEVRGSLVTGADRVTFIATGGVLPADEYTLTLRSAADGFRDLVTGGLLDGDNDGTPGGDYVQEFTVDVVASVEVSLPDVARGPGQPVDVPPVEIVEQPIDDVTPGLPLSLNEAAGVDSVDVTLVYDPALLSITGVSVGPGMPAGSSVVPNLSVSGRVVLSFFSPTPLPAGPADFVMLSAAVPEDAPSGRTNILDIISVRVNEGDIDATADDGMHVVAFPGDATGNGDYSGLDAQRVARVAVGLDAGFEAYPHVDPLVIGDVTGNGTISGLDAQRIAQEAVGLDSPEIPPQEPSPSGPVPNFEPVQMVQSGIGDPADITVDRYSVPVLVDWNSDGLPDLVVGEKTHDREGKIRVYPRVPDDPGFDDFYYAQSAGNDLAVTANGSLGTSPRLIDWDGDGDKDLLIGSADGRVLLLLNENIDTDPQFGAPTAIQVGDPGSKYDLDVGSRATLEIVDWNEDGRQDFVLGAYDGKVRLLLDEASSGVPDFRRTVVVRDGLNELVVPSGGSSPSVADLDGDGLKDLISGNTEGQLVFYTNRGTNEAPEFDGHQLLEANGIAIDLAGTPHSRPHVCDFNEDGAPGIFVGAEDGLVRLFLGQSPPSPLRVAVSEMRGTSASQLTERFLVPIVHAAAARIGSIVPAHMSESLGGLSCDVVDLPDNLLGLASGQTIKVDINAAGYGWFIDTTPWDDAEFSEPHGTHELTALPGSATADRADLLTVIMHELGHVLGLDHSDSGVMDELLPLGTRRVWDDESLLDDSKEFSTLLGAPDLAPTAVDDYFAGI